MKRTITIAPINREKGTTVILHGKYYNEKIKETVNILTTGDVIFGECKDRQKTKNIPITDQNPEFIFTWDDKTDVKGIMEAKAWSKSSEIDCPGNDNLVRAMFKMVDKTEKVTIDVKLIKNKGRVYNIVNNMPTKEMRDIAFFVGLNPIHESPDEIFLKLIDFQDGELMKDPTKFLDNVTTPDMNYIVIAKKAILYDVIQTKDKQYYINTELIGSSFVDVLAYCKSNRQQFEGYIMKEVEKLDVLPIDIDYDKPVKEIIGTVQNIKQPAPIEKSIEEAKAASDAEAEKEKGSNMDELRAAGKKLGIKGYQLMKEETLISKIGEIKQKEEYPELAKEEEYA